MTAGFREARYVSRPGLLGARELGFLQTYAAVQFAAGRFVRDTQCPRSVSLYGDPAFDAVLEWLRAEVAQCVGLDLCPTYSYARIYGQGETLAQHVDRPACEISATLAIRAPSGHSEIYLKPPGGKPVKIRMAEGDACIYAGTEVEHWREPFDRGGYVQLFLHYVSTSGPHYPEHKFDKRGRLGISVDGRRT